MLPALPLLLLAVPRWNLHWDSGIYIALAESLRAGEGLRYMGHELFKLPPGLPLMLAALDPAAPDGLVRMRWFVAVCAVATCIAAWRCFRMRLRPWTAALAALAFAATPLLWFEARHVTTEIPFLAVSLLALLAGDRWAAAPTARRTVVLAAALLVAASLRIIGFLLVPAVLLDALTRRRPAPDRGRPWLAVVATGAIAAGAALLWSSRDALVDDPYPGDLPESQRYERQLTAVDPRNPESPRAGATAFAARAGDAAAEYSLFVAHLFSEHRGDRAWIRVTILSVWALGLVASLRRHGFRAWDWWFLLQAALLLAWPFRYERFLLPLMPMIVLHLGEGVAAAARGAAAAAGRLSRSRFRPAPGRLAAAAVIAAAAAHLAISVPQVMRVIRAERSDHASGSEEQKYREAMAWVRARAAPDAVLVTDAGPIAARLTGRKTFGFPRLDDPERLLRRLGELGTTLVVDDGSAKTRKYLRPAIAAHPGRFVPEFEVAGCVIYAFRP